MPEVNIFVKAKDQASQTLSGIGKSVGGLKDMVGGLGFAAPLAIGAVGAAVGKLAWDAMELEPTRITFDNLTKSIGSTADAMLKELHPATMGVVSDADLMKSANKLISMGLAGSAEEAAKLSKMAVTLGTAMGKQATPAMEEFALMLANQSIPRLDTFGISAGKVRERINELMEADKALTREQAFMAAVMEQGEISMERVGDVSETTTVKMQRIHTAVDNLKIGIGDLLIPVLDGAATAFLDLQGGIRKAKEELQSLKDSTYDEVETAEEYAKAIIKATETTGRYSEVTGGAAREVLQMRLEHEHAVKSVDKLAGGMDNFLEAASNLDAEMAITKELAEGTAAAFGDWAISLDAVQKAIKGQEDYEEALKNGIAYARDLGLEEAERALQLEYSVEILKKVGKEGKIAFIDDLLESAGLFGMELDTSNIKVEDLHGQIEGIGGAMNEPIGKVQAFRTDWESLRDREVQLDVRIDYYYEHHGIPGPGGDAGERLEEAIRGLGMYGL